MTQDELQSLCTYWQKVLRLQDWDIVIRFKRIFDMQHETDGNIDYSLPNKSAIINILEPSDFDNPCFPMDVEEVVVHELLHLHFHEADRPNGECPDSVECGIQKTAEALVKLNRKGGD